MTKYLDINGLNHFKNKFVEQINNSSIRVNILEIICENVELTKENNVYMIENELTLNDDAIYLLTYKYYTDDTETARYCVPSKMEQENIKWLDEKVIMNSTSITDGYLTNEKNKSVITIERINIVYESVKDLLGKDTLINMVYNSIASGNSSHAEGQNTTASGKVSHAEGYGTTASGIYSHAEGYGTTASGNYSHAEGYGTTASRDFSHAEGQGTTASGGYSHVEGVLTIASASGSHAEGQNTTASGKVSHAEGYKTTASGNYSHAGGYATKASAFGQTVIGYTNKEYAGTTPNSKNTDAIFLIGNGSSEDARSNAFRVGHSGVYGSTYYSSGADYAEFFEWVEENQNGEDKVGRFVTLDGDKIRLATYEDEFILGVVSGNPSIIGDSHEDQWKDMYMRDIYGRLIYEDAEVPEIYDELRNIISEAHIEQLPKLNPEYDDTKTYIPRSVRSEWSPVGMMGKLVIEDDGTCEVNGYCYPFENGIARVSGVPTKYRVMKRIDEKHIKVIIL